MITIEEFRLRVKANYNIVLTPWQDKTIKVILESPNGAGKSVMIALLFLIDDKASEIYEALKI